MTKRLRGALSALVLTLPSCGGGGGSNPTPVVTPTPVPTPAATPTPTSGLPAGMVCDPTPPPLYGITVKVHLDSGALRKTLDSRPRVINIDGYCGKAGCIETFLSGPGLAADWSSAELPPEGGSHKENDVASGFSRGAITAEEVVARALDGDSAAEAVLVRYEQRMARALASIINVLDPDVIVLGGGLSNLDRLYRRVPALWGDWVFSDSVDTPLLRALHGDASGVRGAARLW